MTKNDKKPMWKSKTVWVGIAGLCTAIGAYFAGELDLVQLIQTAVVPLAIIFLRMGIENLK